MCGKIYFNDWNEPTFATIECLFQACFAFAAERERSLLIAVIGGHVAVSTSFLADQTAKEGHRRSRNETVNERLDAQWQTSRDRKGSGPASAAPESRLMVDGCVRHPSTQVCRRCCGGGVLSLAVNNGSESEKDTDHFATQSRSTHRRVLSFLRADT